MSSFTRNKTEGERETKKHSRWPLKFSWGCFVVSLIKNLKLILISQGFSLKCVIVKLTIAVVQSTIRLTILSAL